MWSVRVHRALAAMACGLSLTLVEGCSFGPLALTWTHGPCSEAVPQVNKQQLPQGMTPEHPEKAPEGSDRKAATLGLGAGIATAAFPTATPDQGASPESQGQVLNATRQPTASTPELATSPERPGQASEGSARQPSSFGLGAANNLPSLFTDHVAFTTPGGFTALIRGFIVLGINYDQHNIGSSEPLLPPPGSLPSTLRFTANQTQLGFGLKAPPLDGFTNIAYVEGDFLSDAAEGADRLTSRSPRMRQAFWRLGWNEDRDTLLVGQTYVLFGDLLPDPTFDKLRLTLGALVGREPQVRYMHKHPLSDDSDVTFGASVNAPNSGLFNENTDTAERSDLPSVHGKIAFHYDGWGRVNYFGFENLAPRPLEIAVSGFIGQEVADLAGGGTHRVAAEGVALSAVVPIIGIRDNQRAGALGVMAQAWIGKDLDGYFGGNGQGIYETAAGKVDGIVARGFFVGANYFLTQNIWLSAIYSYEENNLPDLVEAGMPFRIASGLFRGPAFGMPGVGHAQGAYLALWFNPLRSLYTSVGWDYRQASYNDGQEGKNNRLNISVFYNF